VWKYLNVVKEGIGANRENWLDDHILRVIGNAENIFF
jgi:hypothetical protein